jgi:protocatechuate 3,4-dioxygenase, alpha subunit
VTYSPDEAGIPTPSQTVGPFFSFALNWMADGALVPPGSPGALTIRGRIVDGAGEPVPDAVVEVYQAAPPGAAWPAWRGFARSLTDLTGAYRLVTVKPDRVDDRQAPHLDVSLFARGLLQRLWTRCYFPDETEANAADPALQTIADRDRVATLIARPDPEGSDPDGPLPNALRFDICLQGDHETVFFDW